MGTTKLVWSEATMEARAEASTAIEKYLRLKQADAHEQNVEQLTDDELEDASVRFKMMSAWIVVAEFVKMEDMEESSVLYGNSGCTPCTQQGLANYAAEDL